jgi:chemotaxis protein methyltransferase CheR
MTENSLQSKPGGNQDAFLPTPYTTQIRELIYQASGIYTPDNRLRFLEERCNRRMAAMRVPSVRDYFEYLTVHVGRVTELKSLLNEITVGETCFFRNQPQLDALQKVVIPGVVANKANQPLRHLRIWSAGCSTGEEAYTLAMMMLENSGGLLKNWTFEIIATDLNENSLLKAQEGIYGDYALRNVKGYYLDKYFEKVGDSYRVGQALRSLVRFSRVNLLDDGRMVFLKAMDVIFCCNVLIYFDSASKRRVVQHFYNNLLPNSYFFLGHSESLFGISGDFKLVHFPGATAYVKTPREMGLK